MSGIGQAVADTAVYSVLYRDTGVDADVHEKWVIVSADAF